jgi:hypothetical protein
MLGLRRDGEGEAVTGSGVDPRYSRLLSDVRHAIATADLYPSLPILLGARTSAHAGTLTRLIRARRPELIDSGRIRFSLERPPVGPHAFACGDPVWNPRLKTDEIRCTVCGLPATAKIHREAL